MFDRRIDQRIAQIVRLQHGVIARRQLLAAGLSAGGIGSRVRHHRLFPVIRGVYSLGSHVDIWGRRCAAVLAAGGDPLSFDDRPREEIAVSDGALAHQTVPNHAASVAAESSSATARLVVLSHWSAAQVHGLTDREPKRHHVTSEGAGRRQQAGVCIHRTRTLPREDIVLASGVPTTSPARTILDSAVGGALRQVRRLIREAEFRELVDAGSMVAVVRRNPRHPGCRIVRSADPGTVESRRRQTPIEDRMTGVLDRLPLDAPIAQHPATGASGRTYRTDFAWPHLRLIVETDGRSSHDRSIAFQDDRARDADLAAAGWLTLRFTWLQLDDPALVAATIIATADTRTSH